MKHVDQERPQMKNAQHSDPSTTPIAPDATVRQKREGPRHSRDGAFFKKIHRKRVPEVRQMSIVECGFACLAMILGYYGRKTSISELSMASGVSRDGLSALSIVRLARNYGMRVRAISLQQNDLRFVKLPAIVHWEFNHYLVVERWSRKYVDVVDPAKGRCRLNHDEFDAGFTGVVITLEPGATFNKRSSTPSSRTFRSYVRQYIRQSPGTILQLLGASLLIQALGLTLPFVTKVVVDQVVPFRMSNVMAVLGIGILVLFFSQAVATLLRGWLLVYVQVRTDKHMLLNFVEHLLALPYSYFQQRSTGDLLTRMTSNTLLREVLSDQLLSTLLDSSLVIFYLFILLWLSLPFGLLTLVIGLLQILLLLGSNRPIRSLASRLLAAQGRSQGYLAEVLAGIVTLKGSGAEQSAFERWSNMFFDQLNTSMRYSYLASTIATIITAFNLLAPLALLWVGATQVLNGSISLGTMVALLALSAAFLSPLASVVASGQQFQLIGAHLDRIADVTGAEPEQKGQEVQQPPTLTGHMRLDSVSFRYAPDAPEVLHSLDLTIEAGQKVAIVGPSGSGKSTLGKLLLGLYVPTEGTILYDGIPLQQLNYQEVRRQFGVVLQEATLFSGSILSNIMLNDPTINKERVVEAAEIAAIHEDILDMPMGYETFVAEGGSALSGGQRQRLAIARAIAHKPPILLFDEATSHLDVATEQRVAEHLSSLACTQIIIAHRLSTIRNADVILVLDQGTIVEKGSHDDLLQRNGYYARLMHQQLEQGILPPDYIGRMYQQLNQGNVPADKEQKVVDANLAILETTEPRIIDLPKEKLNSHSDSADQHLVSSIFPRIAPLSPPVVSSEKIKVPITPVPVTLQVPSNTRRLKKSGVLTLAVIALLLVGIVLGVALWFYILKS
jgi:ATP-binding cassette, subfamily B, bacterial